MDFPTEIQVLIISFITDSDDFHAYTTCCCALYAIGHDRRYEHLRSKKKPPPEEKQHAARFERVKAEFQQAIEDVDLWAHPYHTCYNESVNGFRTHNLPKNKNLTSTCRSRAALSCLQYNEALDLEPYRLQQQLWDHLDGRQEKDKKRKASDMHKSRTLANCRTKAKRANHEKEVSKVHGDTYRTTHKAKKPSSAGTDKVHLSISCGVHACECL